MLPGFAVNDVMNGNDASPFAFGNCLEFHTVLMEHAKDIESVLFGKFCSVMLFSSLKRTCNSSIIHIFLMRTRAKMTIVRTPAVITEDGIMESLFIVRKRANEKRIGKTGCQDLPIVDESHRVALVCQTPFPWPASKRVFGNSHASKKVGTNGFRGTDGSHMGSARDRAVLPVAERGCKRRAAVRIETHIMIWHWLLHNFAAYSTDRASVNIHQNTGLVSI